MLVQSEPVGDRGILTRYACQYMNVSANSGQSSSNREKYNVVAFLAVFPVEDLHVCNVVLIYNSLFCVFNTG